MNQLPKQIFRKWGHSFEEDARDVKVYRPADYDFPRTRGRDGIEFRPDGTFIEWMAGPADAQQAVPQHWQVEPSGRVRVVFGDNARASQILDIVQVDDNILRIRQLPASP